MYKLVAIAGTFDHLHEGHRYFIQKAFKLGHKIIIGLTSDEFVEKSKCKNQNAKIQVKIQKYEERKRELGDFLSREGLLERAEIRKIDDVYGPAVDPKVRLEALVVTDETFEGGKEVNRKRRERGLKDLELIVVDLIKAEDMERISSTRIRGGEIDRWGRLYKSKCKNQNAKLEEKIRSKLKKPLGKLLVGDPNNHEKIADNLKEIIKRINPVMVITVGDEVTRLANSIGLTPELCIFDFRVNRIDKYQSIMDLGFLKPIARAPLGKSDRTGNINSVINPPGCITKELVERVDREIREAINKGNNGEIRVIKIDGEDDLAGVPAVLLAPLGSVVLYGQPGQGVVIVEVTEEKKDKILKLLE